METIPLRLGHVRQQDTDPRIGPFWQVPIHAGTGNAIAIVYLGGNAGGDASKEAVVAKATEIADAVNEKPELMRVLEAVLVHVEPLLFDARKAIDETVDEAIAQAKSGKLRGNGNEPWAFSEELRRSLEAQLDPIVNAVREANAVYDRIAKATDQTV